MLRKLVLENFRNYGKLELNFAAKAGLTYLIGDNGQGKTNLLEAIYMLALGKSFRTSDDADLIEWSAEYGRVKGVIGDKQELEIFLGRPPQPRRVFKQNNVRISANNFVGKAKVVFFHPEDLNMLYLGPDLRRRYLDIMLLQSSSTYFGALRKYKRIREQRNALLGRVREGLSRQDELKIWDEGLVKEGAILWRTRAAALEFINTRLVEKYYEISGEPAMLRATYLNSLELDFHLMSVTSNLEEIFLETLEKNRIREIAAARSLFGPHRDEIEFNLNGKAIASHASRGEFRTILLALKLIEMDYFTEDGGDKPILLLDDVFSELDHRRQSFLLDKVVGYQTFITTTKDSAVINQEKLRDGEFIEVKGGEVV